MTTRAVAAVAGMGAAMLLSTSVLGADDRGFWAARFSSNEPGSLPRDWKPHHFPKIPQHTRFVLKAEGGHTVLCAESAASASGLVRELELDPRALPVLEWSWKIDGAVEKAHWGSKNADDFAARLFVFFDPGGSPFSFFGKIMTKLAGGFPGRTLNYVWAADAAAGNLAPSPYTDRVIMIALQSGNEKAGRWASERRNLVDDFQRAFGRPPRKVVGIGLMTDTDNTRSRSVACYGDIRFLPP